jgi:vacuolar-type H+-ATPase subunit E/Vma4
VTIEEKLEHFLESSLNNSKLQSEQVIQEYTQELDTEFADRKANIDNKASATLLLEKERLIKERNHEVAARQIIIKKELSEMQDQLREQLFSEVRELLDSFMKTDEYVELLVKNYQAAIDFAGDDTNVLYLDPADIDRKAAIEKRLGRELIVSEYPFGGGCRTVLTESEILIDNSFDSIFEEKKQDFTFNGGSHHD